MLRQGSPDSMKAFVSLAAAATASNTIDTKTKELMALAIGIAIHCGAASLTTRRWRTSTGRRSRRFSKSSPSLFYMGGRPAAVYCADAVRAYDQFSGQPEIQR